MKRYMTLALTAFLFIACKKEKIETTTCNQSQTQETQENTYVFPTTIGSYWVYEWYQIDSLGTETAMTTIDSVFITGDTLINNELFTVYSESFLGNPSIRFKRDSSGYIIDQYGGIEYSYVDFNTTFDGWNNPEYTSSFNMIDMTTTPITVLAGVFKTIERRKSISKFDGSTISSCAGNTVIYPTNYASGIGKVRFVTSYISSIPLCHHFEQRLINYYIP